MADRNGQKRSFTERAAAWMVSSRLLMVTLVVASTALFVWAGGRLLWNTRAMEEAVLIGRIGPTEGGHGPCRVDVLYLEKGKLPAEKGIPVHVTLDEPGRDEELDALVIDKDPQGSWFTIEETPAGLRGDGRSGNVCPFEIDQGRLRIDYRKDRLLTLLLER